MEHLKHIHMIVRQRSARVVPVSVFGSVLLKPKGWSYDLDAGCCAGEKVVQGGSHPSDLNLFS